MTSTADVLEILQLPVLVVLDEAYIEFSGEESKMAWVQQYPNLVVLRTFSKSAGLAGLRVSWPPPGASRAVAGTGQSLGCRGTAASAAACLMVPAPPLLPSSLHPWIDPRATQGEGLR
jgi:histidinol-phosphate aminotransferase